MKALFKQKQAVDSENMVSTITKDYINEDAQGQH